MSNAADKIITYTNEMSFIDFIDNETAIDAVIRNFAILGEASSKISKQLMHDYPVIEWAQIIGFRNRLVHEYFQIDYEIIWKIRQKMLGDLVDSIEEIIKDLIEKGRENFYD
jgi:uncharacterized protein with HEPN domain